MQYYGNSITTFTLKDDGKDGTELILTDEGVPLPDRTEVIAGWVSVLMNLKAGIDYGIDLRNHEMGLRIQALDLMVAFQDLLGVEII